MVLSQDEIRKEMLISAKQWGLVVSGKNKKHSNFVEKAIKTAIDSSRPVVSTQEVCERRIMDLRSSKLPKDIDDAVQKVLEAELEDTEDCLFVETEDRLGLYFEPFYRYIDRWSKQEVYRRRKDFEGIKLDELDPFKRFTAVEMDPKDWFHMIWYDGGGSLLGTVYEAVVAHHMEHFVSCRNCFRMNSLRWNGGLDVLSSWADVVCTNCDATYEIKSKASTEKVDKRFEFNGFRGGSFKTYYKYYPQSKRYLVVVSRGESYNTERKAMSCRVSVAEIERVVPRLHDESFVNEGRIFSEVNVKKNSIKKVWFHTPPYRGNFQEIASKVYIERFGKDAWNRNKTIDENQDIVDVVQVQQDPGKIKETNREQIDEAATVIDEIRESLNTLKLDMNDDDGGWEDLYESD